MFPPPDLRTFFGLLTFPPWADGSWGLWWGEQVSLGFRGSIIVTTWCQQHFYKLKISKKRNCRSLSGKIDTFVLAISGIFVFLIPFSSKPNFSGVYNCKAKRIRLPKKGSPCRNFLSYFQCFDSLDYFVETTRIWLFESTHQNTNKRETLLIYIIDDIMQMLYKIGYNYRPPIYLDG